MLLLVTLKHGRAETETLLEGLEIIPLIVTDYKGVQLAEMDLESVLKRRQG
jgi:two-component system sensor histidine kinase KdpD